MDGDVVGSIDSVGSIEIVNVGASVFPTVGTNAGAFVETIGAGDRVGAAEHSPHVIGQRFLTGPESDRFSHLLSVAVFPTQLHPLLRPVERVNLSPVSTQFKVVGGPVIPRVGAAVAATDGLVEGLSEDSADGFGLGLSETLGCVDVVVRLVGSALIGGLNEGLLEGILDGAFVGLRVCRASVGPLEALGVELGCAETIGLAEVLGSAD